MRLRVHTAAANEELIALVNEGYEVLASVQVEYRSRAEKGTYTDSVAAADDLIAPVEEWASKVLDALQRIFPTPLEANLFSDPEIPFGAVSGDYHYQSAMLRSKQFVRGLNSLRKNSLPEYTDLPLDARLFVEDIDSFRKVRDVNPAAVLDILRNGYIDRSEDSVQMALERILSVPVHKADWGGEQNDLYTANVLVGGTRHETAFLLKGNGLSARRMEIKHCGRNGDQLLRLCQSPARLFVVQFVGTISEAVISDIDGKVRQARAEGKEAWYCIMDGQDTARVLRAYGEA